MAYASHLYRNPMEILAAKQERENREAAKRRQREEAMADVMSAQRLRPAALKPAEPAPRKPLREFLAEESAPPERSEAWKRAEALFK